MTRKTALLLGLALALLVLAVLCTARHIAPLEAGLADSAGDALAAAGETGIEVRAENGRDIRLTGSVADRETRDRA